MDFNILQRHIGFYLDNDNLNKAIVNCQHLDGTYDIRYLESGDIDNVDLENRNDWKILYTPQEFIDEMIQSIFRHTRNNPINGFHVLYERKHEPLKIIHLGNGNFIVKFSIGDFDKYHHILYGIDNTIEDVFSVDGILDFENNLKISHEYCTLGFEIPEHYMEYCFVEVE